MRFGCACSQLSHQDEETKVQGALDVDLLGVGVALSAFILGDDVHHADMLNGFLVFQVFVGRVTTDLSNECLLGLGLGRGLSQWLGLSLWLWLSQWLGLWLGLSLWLGLRSGCGLSVLSSGFGLSVLSSGCGLSVLRSGVSAHSCSIVVDSWSVVVINCIIICSVMRKAILVVKTCLCIRIVQMSVEVNQHIF